MGLAYSATVCGALPVVNIGRRDLAACDIRAVAGVFNATSNSILAAMARGGSYADALRQAQLDGIAEADPSLDVEGWDTANKLVIIANSILRQPCTLADVQPVIGITDITPAQIREGAARGEVVKLVARAESDLTGWQPVSYTALRPARMAARGQFPGLDQRLGDGHRLRHRHHGPAAAQSRRARPHSHRGGDAAGCD